MDDTTDTTRIVFLEQALGARQAELEACHAAARRTAHDLGERVKELTCLYAVSSLLQPSAALQEVIEGVAHTLVPAYQFPEITGARVTLHDRTFATPGLRQGAWRQAAPLRLDGEPVGSIEVFYSEPRPDADEGPFLKEERLLIDTVAEMVSRHLHRRRIEEELRERERKYRTLVENLYEGIWLADRDNNTLFLNNRMAELLGYPAEEVIGRNVFSFVEAKEREAGERYILSRSVREVEFLRKDGGRFWARIASTPLHDEQGRYQGALAGVVDISERKRTEAALAQEEERVRRQAAELEAIYWWTPVGLAVLDRELRFLRVNRRLAEINGVPAEAHIGRSLAEIAPGVAAQAEPLHRRIMATGEPALDVEFEARTPAEPGQGRCWNTQWLPLSDGDGKIWGVNVVVEEITERKRWEDDLYRREQEFEALAERSPDMIARMDRSGRFLYVNSAVARVTGFGREWFEGKGLDDLPLPTENRSLRKRAIEEVFRTRFEQTLEHAYETGAGMRYFHTRLVPELGRDGGVESVLVVDRDVTDLKRVQHALEQLTLHDPLTGVANRRYLDQFIAREWRRALRHRYPVALVMADIDHFKPYNDRLGHPQGDACLREVAHALETQLHRPTDLLVRYGGEEFLVVLPETGYLEALQMAEAMRKTIESFALPHPASPVGPVLTASFGVVAAPAEAGTFQELLAQADQALYRAKQAGRNRVEGLRFLTAP